MKTPRHSHIDFARWSMFENRGGQPLLRGDFSYMRPQDGERHAVGAMVSAREVIKALGGNERNVNSYNDGQARFMEITGAKECAVFINWAGKHKPAIVETFAKAGILPEFSLPAQARNAAKAGAVTPAPEPAPVPKTRLKPAIHFARWTQVEKNGAPVLVATFSSLGNTQGILRYHQARAFFDGLDAVDHSAIADHMPALSLEIRGKKACRDFVGWVERNMPGESAAILATGIATQIADTPKPPRKHGKQPPQQLPLLDESWVAKAEMAKAKRGKGGLLGT